MDSAFRIAACTLANEAGKSFNTLESPEIGMWKPEPDWRRE
jgi:hypothetical protein